MPPPSGGRQGAGLAGDAAGKPTAVENGDALRNKGTAFEEGSLAAAAAINVEKRRGPAAETAAPLLSAMALKPP